MKKLLSVIIVLSLCLSLSSCSGNYEKHSVASAAAKLNVKHSDAEKEGYSEFIDKLDVFAAKHKRKHRRNKASKRSTRLPHL